MYAFSQLIIQKQNEAATNTNEDIMIEVPFVRSSLQNVNDERRPTISCGPRTEQQETDLSHNSIEEPESVGRSTPPVPPAEPKQEADPFLCSDQDINKYIDKRIKDFSNI